MSFKELDLSFSYRTGEDSYGIVNSFYNPVLSNSVLYKRAVGYFTSSSLSVAARGISELIKNGGRMELIASPVFEEADVEAIKDGYLSREEAIEKSLLKEVKSLSESIEEERLNYLSWLISEGRLDIKIALFKNEEHIGIYHEKVGIMFDTDGNKIAFSGSSNETTGGLVNNFESIDVYCSWIERESERVEDKLGGFNELWNDSNQILEVMEFPEAARKEVLKHRKTEFQKVDIDYNTVNEKDNSYNTFQNSSYYPDYPDELVLRDYQKQAINSWSNNGGQGFLEMATGTGKTITAISAATALYHKFGRLALIITCPYQDLAHQWVKDLNWFNMKPILAFSGQNWMNQLKEEVTNFNTGISTHFCLICVNDTFSSKRMQDILSGLKNDVMFIADEAHHLGTKNYLSNLNESFSYRMGLSATPHRWFDEEGTDSLIKYFGGEVVFEFTLEEAIGEHLTNYFYYPEFVTLNEEEYDKYLTITRQISQLINKESDDEKEQMQNLLIRRSKILQNADNKIHHLSSLMQDKTGTTHNIFYCGDGKVDGDKRSVEAVTSLLGRELGMKVHRFTSKESGQERKSLLQKFDHGDYQGLVAIKCLDEGVDIPATKTAYILSSTTNPREFVQRRGRVLRKHEDKDFAYIYDFFVLPRPIEEIRNIESSVFNVERSMIKKELQRFNEFARLSLNYGESLSKLSEVKDAYNLIDI